MSDQITYTEVELCTYNDDISKSWFVYFDITDHSTGETSRKQFRGGINYYKDLKVRLHAGRELKIYWQERLDNGWSPFGDCGRNNLSSMRFNEALDWALTKCNLATKTKRDYAGTVQFFKAAAEKLHFDKTFITMIRRQHIMLMLDKIKVDRKWSNNAYNKNAVYLSGVLARLVTYMVIDNNPAHNILKQPVTETNKYETITDEEKIIIRDHLTKVHPTFFTYLMLIYHTGMRPKECLALKVSDVYLDKNLIIIKPVFDEENSKTPSIRMVPLNKHINELLRLHLHESHEKDFYVFGTPNGPGGNRGSQKGGISGARRSDYFYPSALQMKRDTATNLWMSLVKIGLKINKYMYALKHTGGDDKILAGISIDALREMYGHTSKFMTEKYAKKIKGVYREQIIVNSPDF